MKHLSFETTAVQESKHRSSRPPPSPPPSFFVLLLFSATQLPSCAASAYLFPGPRMAVINRAREAGIRGIKRATCCCLHVRVHLRIPGKKRFRTTVSPTPFTIPFYACRFFFVFSIVLSSSSTYAFAFNPPVTRIIIGKSAFSIAASKVSVIKMRNLFSRNMYGLYKICPSNYPGYCDRNRVCKTFSRIDWLSARLKKETRVARGG